MVPAEPLLPSTSSSGTSGRRSAKASAVKQPARPPPAMITRSAWLADFMREWAWGKTGLVGRVGNWLAPLASIRGSTASLALR
jgi:hypothetical protein